MDLGSGDEGSDPSRNYRIAIVDDHPMLRRGLRDLINEQAGWCVCCEAEDSDDAALCISESAPDLVILDLMLHKRNALSFLSKLKESPDAPKVLVLTLHPEEIYGERAIAAGADGFITKEQPSEEILRAVRTVAAGERYLSERLRERIEAGSAMNGNGGADVYRTFTDRELEVFQLMGQGQSAKQIANELGISPKTVETYQAHLKEKLGVTSGTELARNAILWMAEQTE